MLSWIALYRVKICCTVDSMRESAFQHWVGYDGCLPGAFKKEVSLLLMTFGCAAFRPISPSSTTSFVASACKEICPLPLSCHYHISLHILSDFQLFITFQMQKWSLQTHNHKFPWFLYLFVWFLLLPYISWDACYCSDYYTYYMRLQFHYCPMWHKSHKANFIQ